MATDGLARLPLHGDGRPSPPAPPWRRTVLPACPSMATDGRPRLPRHGVGWSCPPAPPWRRTAFPPSAHPAPSVLARLGRQMKHCGRKWSGAPAPRVGPSPPMPLFLQVPGYAARPPETITRRQGRGIPRPPRPSRLAVVTGSPTVQARPAATAAASCDVRYRHGTEVRSRAPAPPPVARFGTATVPKCAVARPGRRRLRGLVPPRYRSVQSRLRAAASCAVWYRRGTEVRSRALRAAAGCAVCYRHGTEVRSRAPAPPPVVRFGTATVPKCAVARPRRRQLCGLLPPRYRSAQSRARAAAGCAVWYRHGTEVRSRAPGPPPVVRFGTATVPKCAVARPGRGSLWS
jgi:hypothetical protein